MQNTLTILVRGIELIVLAALILAALYVCVGRLLVSTSEFFRTDLEDLLETRYAVSVQTGSVQGSWQRFDTIVDITDIRIGDPDNPALKSDTVRVRISPLHSLIKGRLVVTEIDFLNLYLSLEEHTPGKWNVVGMTGFDKPVDFEYLLDSLPQLNVVRILDMSVVLNGLRSSYIVSNMADKPIELLSEDDLKIISMPVNLTKSGSEENRHLHLMGEYHGHFGEPDFSGQFYLDISQLQLLDFLHPVDSLKELESIDVNGQIWAEFDADDFEFRGHVNVDSQTEGSLPINADLQFGARGVPGRVWFYGENIRLVSQDNEIQLQNVNTVLEEQLDIWSIGIQIPALDLGEFAGMLTTLGAAFSVVPVRLTDFVSGTSPDGSLNSTIAVFKVDETLQDLRIASILSEVNLRPHLGIPGISNMNGLASIGLDSGYVDIRSQQSSVHFSSTFSDPWLFDSIRGRLNFRNNNGATQLSSGLVEVLQGDASAYGKMMVNLESSREQGSFTPAEGSFTPAEGSFTPAEGSFTPAEGSYNPANGSWGLVVGICNGDLSDFRRYLPTTLKPEVLSWSDQAIKSGTVTESGLLLHGELVRSAPKINKALDGYFHIADGVLDYHPDWPGLFGIAATFHVGHSGIFTNNATALFLNSEVLSGNASVPIHIDGTADTIHINGKFQGIMQDAINVLQETPIADQISHSAREWSGVGDITGHLTLEIPIGARRGEDPEGDITVVMRGNELVFSDLDLHVKDLSSEIRYTNRNGLTSEGFTASLFDESINGFIDSELKGESGEITINFSGFADVENIYHWSEQNLLSRAEGKSEYKVAVHIPYGGDADQTYIEAISDLRGTRLNLPKPLAKDADTERLFNYRQSFLESGYQIDLSLGDMKGTFYTEDGLIRDGQFHFGPGKSASIPSREGINVTGSLSYASYEEWDRFLDELSSISDVSIKSELEERTGTVSLEIGELMFYSMELENVSARINRDMDAWKVNLSSEAMEGSVMLPDDDEKPMQIALDHLRFPEKDDSPDPMESVDPKDLGKIDFSTEELIYGDEHYGSWAFQMRPDQTGAKIQNLSAELRGLTLQEGAELSWVYNDGRHGSAFQGTVTADDIGSTLTSWGFASSIEGSDFSFNTNLTWNGSPAAMDIDIVEGQLHIDKGKGRFVQAETGTGVLKLLGIFDFVQIGRRFQFDFDDVVQKGWSFNNISGAVKFNKGSIDVLEPVVIEGSSNILKIGGSVDLDTKQLDNDLIVTLPVNRNLPWYAAYSTVAGGPLIGFGVMLVRKVMKKQIDQMSSAKYKVAGTWEDPEIVFVTIFNDSVREVGTEETASQ